MGALPKYDPSDKKSMVREMWRESDLFDPNSLARKQLRALDPTAPAPAPELSTPAKPPEPVSLTDKAIEEARKAELRRQKGLTGLGGTFLTGAAGSTPTATPTPKTLLGL